MAKLEEYNRIRNFEATPEPAGEVESTSADGPLRFFVQLHYATGLHYDFRLEVDGVLKSFAVPKGPSLNPLDQRLAVHVEDHPIKYGSFEGIIPPGNYGAGTVLVWDVGTYTEKTSSSREESDTKMRLGFAQGHMKIVLDGHKLRGEYALVRLKDKKSANAWMLFKKRDQHAAIRDVLQDGVSARSGRTIKEIEAEAPAKGEVWLSQRLTPEKGVKRANVRKPAAPPPKPAKTPGLIKPMQPVMKDLSSADLDAPESYLWAPVSGGTRVLAFTGRGAKLVSARGLDLGRKHPEALARLRQFRETLVFDGELAKRGPHLALHDLLWEKDQDLRPLPLVERRAKLVQLDFASDSFLSVGAAYATPEEIPGETLHVLAKDRMSPYREGVSDEWLKLPAAAQPARAPRVVLTNGEKLLWPAAGLSKRHLFDYYAAVATAMVPHLEGRPLSLLRFPDGVDGEGFFQKDVAGFVPSWFRRERIFSPSSNRSIDYAVCDNEPSLLHLANWGTIELNPWLSRIETPDRPTYAAFDFDPDAQEYPEVAEIALKLRDELDALGFHGFAKTSGATGIHVAVPLGAAFDYDEARAFAEFVMKRVHEHFPAKTTLEAQPSKRRGALYLDFRQNRRGQTLAAPYSARPTPRGTVSAPVTWEELEHGFAPEDATILTMPSRLARLGDLWAEVLQPPSAEAIAEMRRILAQI